MSNLTQKDFEESQDNESRSGEALSYVGILAFVALVVIAFLVMR